MAALSQTLTQSEETESETEAAATVFNPQVEASVPKSYDEVSETEKLLPLEAWVDQVRST